MALGQPSLLRVWTIRASGSFRPTRLDPQRWLQFRRCLPTGQRELYRNLPDQAALAIDQIPDKVLPLLVLLRIWWNRLYLNEKLSVYNVSEHKLGSRLVRLELKMLGSQPG